MSVGVQDYTKLVSVICVILASTILGFKGVMGGDAVTALLGGCLGYVFGNGHGVLSAKATVKDIENKILSGGNNG